MSFDNDANDKVTISYSESPLKSDIFAVEVATMGSIVSRSIVDNKNIFGRHCRILVAFVTILKLIKI